MLNNNSGKHILTIFLVQALWQGILSIKTFNPHNNFMQQVLLLFLFCKVITFIIPWVENWNRRGTLLNWARKELGGHSHCAYCLI